jgi:hypothetical protein
LPAPGHAEGAQDREFRRVEDKLAAEQLPDDGQRDQARERGEDRQRGGLRPDRPLGRGMVGGQVDDVGLPHAVTRREGSGPAGERGGAGAGPQQHAGAAASRIERRCLPGAGERLAQQQPRLRAFPGG